MLDRFYDGNFQWKRTKKPKYESDLKHVTFAVELKKILWKCLIAKSVFLMHCTAEI